MREVQNKNQIFREFHLNHLPATLENSKDNIMQRKRVKGNWFSLRTVGKHRCHSERMSPVADNVLLGLKSWKESAKCRQQEKCT